MQIFISWSGNRSKKLAEAFSTWLPTVIQQAKPYFSPEMEKGARWSEDIFQALTNAKLGVIFLTPENLSSRWIQFEAGALVKALDKARVCTVLISLTPAQVEMPLGMFQATQTTKDDVWKLLCTINAAFERTQQIEESRLKSIFEKFWPEFEAAIDAVVNEKVLVDAPKRPENDLLEELVVLNRQLVDSIGSLDTRSIRDLANELSRGRFNSVFRRMLGPNNQESTIDGQLDPRRPLTWKDLEEGRQTWQEVQEEKSQTSARKIY